MSGSYKKYIRTILMAALVAALYTSFLAFILYGKLEYRKDHMIFDYAYAVVYFLLLCYSYKKIINFCGIQFDQTEISHKKYLKALFLFVLTSLFLITIVGLIPFLLILETFISPAGTEVEIRLNYIFNVIFASAYFSVRSAWNILLNYKNARIQAEIQKRESTKARLETLKNQVSPHFLFNSLNALSSLIYIDEDKATKFVDELAGIFRYVMENKDFELVALKKELDFINAYFFLLKIRFRDSIQPHLNIDATTLEQMLPPLTLQMLVENAIKHNIVSKDQPLTIDIFTENNTLVVKNNFQKRESAKDSIGIGLKNIINRYGFLTDRKVDIELTKSEFIARIPLLKEEEVQ